jgi:hypothetical protein
MTPKKMPSKSKKWTKEEIKLAKVLIQVTQNVKQLIREIRLEYEKQD